MVIVVTGVVVLGAGISMKNRGHKIAAAEAANFAFGGAQLIWRSGDDGYVSGSDHRKDGLAVGY